MVKLLNLIKNDVKKHFLVVISEDYIFLQNTVHSMRFHSLCAGRENATDNLANVILLGSALHSVTLNLQHENV